nr:uncharacterized protein LOC115497384 isoform X2 [Taeniopygia guttata]
MAELAGGRAGYARGGSPVPREEDHSRAQLLGSRPGPGHRSSSSSICSEDSAASFGEGMPEPLLCPQEPAGGVPGAGACCHSSAKLSTGAHPGQDEPSLPAGTSPAVAVGPGRAPRQDRAPSRSSLESLGARISRLSRSHRGVARGVPWPGPPAQPAPGHGGSPREELLCRAATRTGSPGSSARARGHPALQPAALWGRGGSVTFPMADVGRKGAPSSRSAGTAMGAPRRWGSPVSPGLRGDKEGGLPCKGVAGQPLQRSQEGTRELGSGAKPWSQGDRARTGLALLGHTWDTHHLCHTDLQRMSWQGQGARVGQEWLDKERRKTATSQEEKLELLERLRELERGRRSLLRQRLQVLLRRDTADTLRQLREALEQERLSGLGGRAALLRLSLPLRDRAGRSGRREHLPSRPRGAAVPGRAGGSPRSPPEPPRALGRCSPTPEPSPAALRWVRELPGGTRGSRWCEPSSPPAPSGSSRALLVLRGLRQQIQRRLGQWQRLQGALEGAGQSKEDGEQRQQPEKTPAPGAPREPPVQSQREHPHPASIPGLPQPGRGSRGLLQHFQELQLEQTPNTGSPNALGAQLGTGDREGQPGVGAVPQPLC